MTDPAGLDPDWERYPDTVFLFSAAGTGGPRLRIDLRAKVTGEDRRALAALGLDRFAVVTAHDPAGVDLPANRNRERQAELEAELRSRGVHYVRVDACSPDGEHCEQSVAVALSEREAGELARGYGQVAIFWFDGGRFWIVEVPAGSRRVLPADTG